jgi:hypothetical protein
MIDITKPVRTRDGTPVEIISDKGRDPYTLVGYIGNGRELDEWAADGAYLPGTKSNNDLENYEPEPVRWNCLDPLPEPKPEEWAAEKAAFVEGRAIQFQPKGFGEWFDCPEPTWSSDFKYRIKPEPQWVPMEPDDIVVGMEFANDTGTRYQWTEVDTYGVTLLDSPISFERLLRLGYEYRINGGEWKPCKKEVQV